MASSSSGFFDRVPFSFSKFEGMLLLEDFSRSFSGPFLSLLPVPTPGRQRERVVRGTERGSGSERGREEGTRDAAFDRKKEREERRERSTQSATDDGDDGAKEESERRRFCFRSSIFFSLFLSFASSLFLQEKREGDSAFARSLCSRAGALLLAPPPPKGRERKKGHDDEQRRRWRRRRRLCPFVLVLRPAPGLLFQQRRPRSRVRESPPPREIRVALNGRKRKLRRAKWFFLFRCR